MTHAAEAIWSPSLTSILFQQHLSTAISIFIYSPGRAPPSPRSAAIPQDCQSHHGERLPAQPLAPRSPTDAGPAARALPRSAY